MAAENKAPQPQWQQGEAGQRQKQGQGQAPRCKQALQGAQQAQGQAQVALRVAFDSGAHKRHKTAKSSSQQPSAAAEASAGTAPTSSAPASGGLRPAGGSAGDLRQRLRQLLG
eukprot:CAMPEP_0202871996 /NCGR_PEP_ID=MMETSP1391-20130828/20153_1 /ASSEMBLY_ACC=CAM_ASM_000867 /TAXON_ID=1034604 /ORGANISM="Chlamydomonas leiostraca, Strain SAG 11-49" /LENGTH=112 /DNA_ID=CAMNT_0049552935 /DNA_START=171 /DNA_END=507 /DNA_ORIENTATION=+